MRTTRRLAALASLLTTGLAGAVFAQALPAPPYQTADQGLGAGYNASQTMDRYGGGQRSTAPFAPSIQGYQAPAPYQPQSQPQLPAGGRLAWSGKTEPQTQQVRPAQSGDWSSMTQRWGSQTAPQPRAPTQAPAQGVAQQGWRPYRPQIWNPQPTQQAPVPAPAPASIYSPPSQTTPTMPPPPAAQYRQAQNGAGGPRFYSVHREYGIEPDAIPLPPQFFGATADLSAPNTDPLVKRTTVNGQSHNVPAPDDQGAQ